MSGGADGSSRSASAAAVGGGRSDGEDRAGPRPLRVLPPASGSRRCDAGRDLLRTDAVALFRDPASPRQAGERPDGSAISRRLPQRGAFAASPGAKSSLNGGLEDQRRALEWADVRAPSGSAKAKLWSLRVTAPRNSHCHPTDARYSGRGRFLAGRVDLNRIVRQMEGFLESLV